MEKIVVKLVQFGNGGDTLHYSGKEHGYSLCRVQGYGSPERPHAAVPGENKIFPDGTPVVEVREAVGKDAGFLWAYKGPMVDVDLPEGQIDAMSDIDSVFVETLRHSGGQYGAMLTIHKANKLASPKVPGPLDTVCISEWVKGWRDHGARIGHYKNNVIVWEN